MEKQVELGARVWAENETVGIVEKIVVDPEHHEPGYLVGKQGRIPPRQRHIVVPVSLVSEVLPGAVTLATTPAALASFPEYEITVRKGEYQKPIPPGYPRPYGLSTPVSNQGYMVIRARSVPDTFLPISSLLYDMQWVESLLYSNPSKCPSGFETEHPPSSRDWQT